jgi:hypothetical protein
MSELEQNVLIVDRFLVPFTEYRRRSTFTKRTSTMSRPNYEKSEEELNDLPIEWERHEKRDKWAVLRTPSGVQLTYHMSRRTYRIEGKQPTTKAAPELLHKRFFKDQDPYTVPFGMYEGHSVEWVVQKHRSYAEWMLGVAEEQWLQEALKEELGHEEE